MIRRLGGHLGPDVSALVDGQLGPEATDRAWEHVFSCAQCRGEVEREAWVKRRLAAMSGDQPSDRLLDVLHALSATPADSWHDDADAWAEAQHLEEVTRSRRLTGFALAGAGGMSAAVLGFAALSLGAGGPAGAPASISGSTPSSGPTSAVLPVVAEVQGRLPGWRVTNTGPGVATAVPAFSRR